MAGILSPSASPDTHFLFEERYQQLERNFNAVVLELKARPEGQPQQLQTLLKRMEAELRHQVLRAQGAGSGTAQRLVERESILQRNFEAVVALMDGGDLPPATSPPAGAAGGTPTTPAARASSPHSTQHPWQQSSSYEPAVTPDSSNHVAASPLPAGAESPALQAAAEREASLRQQLQQKEAAAVAAAAANDGQAASLREELRQVRPLPPPAPRPPSPLPKGHACSPNTPPRGALLRPRLPIAPLHAHRGPSTSAAPPTRTGLT
jgi:hypothetical protein